MQPFLYPAPVGKLRTTVTGDRLHQLRRKARERGDYGVLHRLCPAVRHLHRYVKPRLALCQSRKAGFALTLPAYHRIRFPMPGLLSAVHRLVPLADRLALVVFAPCLLDSMALSLAAQHFQVAVHEIFLVYPAVDGPPAGQVQLTGRTCDLLRRPRCTKLLVYVVDDLLGVEHTSVAV